MKFILVLCLLMTTSNAVMKYKKTSNAKMTVMGDEVDWENGEVEEHPSPRAKSESKPLKGSAVD